MLALRVLTGPQAGQIYHLKQGKHKIGRASSSDLQLSQAGVSKEHLEFQVFPEKIILTDLRSSNGTYVNGVRVQNALVRLGDKISIHDVLCDIVIAPETKYAPSPATVRPQQPSISYPLPVQDSAPEDVSEPPAPIPPALSYRVKKYIDDVVMPAVYRLVEVFEMKTIVWGFSFIFVFIVTLLSIFPMKYMTAESIAVESRRRALTVARALASANEKIIRQGDISSFSTDLVLREEGIDDVYIVSRDGSIIAPAERAGSSPKEAGFFKSVKGRNRDVSDEISNGRIAAASPILAFDPELQQNVARAYAVVIYNPGSLAFDDGRALSLFMQMLILASVVGLVLFFLLYRVTEYPFVLLNQQLDAILREGRDHAHIPVKSAIVQETLVNLNSLLARSQAGNSSQHSHNSLKDTEFSNLLLMIPYPALLISREKAVVGLNSAFEHLTGVSFLQVQGQSIQFLPDQALQKNILSLLDVSKEKITQINSDSLEVGGHHVLIQCQALTLAQGDPDYYLITFSPMADEGAA